MLEIQKVDDNPETSKNSIIDSSTSRETTLKSQTNNFETLTIKQKQTTSRFETFIMNAYKKLVGFSPDKKGAKKPAQKNEISLQEENLNVNECEKELRKALEELESIKNIFVNKNIIDKTVRIIKRNKINLSFLIGKIYCELMCKKNIFSRLNQKNSLDKNIIISFINEVINMNNLLKNTYLGDQYEKVLFCFLENIIKEIAFDSEQLNEINTVLQEHKAKKEEIKINTKSSSEFLTSVNEAFNKQNSLYGQYKVILDNADAILQLMNNANCSESNEVHDFFEFGILLIKLFFGKKCILLNEKNNSEDNNTIKKLFDGFEDNSHGNINIILGEKFYVDYEKDLEPMREKLCEIIIKYIEKFKNITNLLEFQYIHFALLKRIYFYYFEKYETEILPLFVQILINLCVFKESDKIKQVVLFVNALLNSEDEKDNNFKELLKQKIEEAKNNVDFNFDEGKELKGDMEQIQNEYIYIDETNLNLGFFTDIEIESGDTFVFYVELAKSFGFIDFSLIVKGYDINLTVTNLTEGNVVYEEKKLKTLSEEEKKKNSANPKYNPFKLNLFFTKPGIFKFELDNSYSWLRNKNISYKVNVFYPQIPSIFENKNAISKYQEIMNNFKRLSGTKPSNEHMKEIIQSHLSYQYNIDDIKQNIELLNSMLVSSQIKILTIYLDKEKEEGEGKEKKYFYYEKENLVKNELTKENFDEYINENKNKEGTTTIVNLFIVTGDGYKALNNSDLSVLKVLEFEPTIEEGKNNILYFIQYFGQAQLLYYLINKTNELKNSLLINYTKFGGYQIVIYVNGEIITEVEELKTINKDESLETNIDLISGCLKKLGQDQKIFILLTDSIDVEEKNITIENMSQAIQKSLGINAEEEGNYKIIRLNKDFNKSLERYTHLLNLIE